MSHHKSAIIKNSMDYKKAIHNKPQELRYIHKFLDVHSLNGYEEDT